MHRHRWNLPPLPARCCWRSQDQACKCFGFHREIQKWQGLGHVQDEDQAPFEERGKSSAPYSGSLCWVCCILMPEKNVNIETCQKQPWEVGVLAGPADGSLHTCGVRDISEWIQGKYLADTQGDVSPYISPEARRAAKQLLAGPLSTGWFKSLFLEATASGWRASLGAASHYLDIVSCEPSEELLKHIFFV